MSVALGIDTSSRGFHVAASEPIDLPRGPDLEGPGELMVFGPSRLGYADAARLGAQDRRRVIYHSAKTMFSRLPAGAVVAIEEPLVLPKNIDTTMKLVMVAGVIEAAFWEACPDATLWWVNVSTWRRRVLNPPKGQAPRRKDAWKALARRYIEECGAWSSTERLTMEVEPDLWDAACICEYAVIELVMA